MLIRHESTLQLVIELRARMPCTPSGHNRPRHVHVEIRNYLGADGRLRFQVPPQIRQDRTRVNLKGIVSRRDSQHKQLQSV